MNHRIKFFIIPALILLMTAGVPCSAKPLFPNEEPEFLDVTEAFRLLANFEGENSIRIEYSIANGYYLYRPKFRIATETPGFSLGEPKFPSGQVINDEYYGNIETYRIQVIIELPVTRSDNAGDLLSLSITSQGCADAGLCYQPNTQTVDLPVP